MYICCVLIKIKHLIRKLETKKTSVYYVCLVFGALLKPMSVTKVCFLKLFRIIINPFTQMKKRSEVQ